MHSRRLIQCLLVGVAPLVLALSVSVALGEGHSTKPGDGRTEGYAAHVPGPVCRTDIRARRMDVRPGDADPEPLRTLSGSTDLLPSATGSHHSPRGKAPL
jgi:hypothetical protein